MIKLFRVRTEQAIPSSFRGATPRDRLVELMKSVRDKLAAGQEVKLKINSKWSVVKKQLLAETNQKCAYCESHTSAVAFGDVEHYRPKSVYWWLAYVYDNYLASCSICNQKFKGKIFEISGMAMAPPPVTATTTETQMERIAETAIPDPMEPAAVVTFVAKHRTEAPLIPNPYFDDPEQIFSWDVLDGTKEVEVVPQPTFPNAAAIVDASERIYGLNRTQLKRRRYNQFRSYRLSRLTVDSPGITQELRDMHQEMIDLMQEPDSEYAAMIRFFETH